jgi:hypothetical protein|tara:strand:+ start:416 stop:553 length:138 start_codon:yes stop_codon:yes gene_type:complete
MILAAVEGESGSLCTQTFVLKSCNKKREAEKSTSPEFMTISMSDI